MTTRRCVITDYMGDDTEVEERLLSQAGFEVIVAPSPAPSDWLSHAVESDAILTRHAPISAETIARLKSCRVISRYGTGHDNIDVAAAARRSIVVTNVPGYCTDEVADHALLLLLMCARHADRLTSAVKLGGWTPTPLPPINRIQGRRLGLVGVGRIGRAVADRAVSFGLKVAAFDPYVSSTPEGIEMVSELQDLLRTSDFISLHLPLTDSTHHILDEHNLSMLREGAIVVNVSRGGLVDLDAAIPRVRSGALGGLALDVTEAEPVEPDHPVRSTPGVVLTPHVGYYSTSSVREAKERSVAEIKRVVNGEDAEFPVTI